MKLVGYIRVSTDKQGKSGLGLEAQRRAVAEYARQHNGESVAEYREVETGKRSNRPQLQAALAHAKQVRGKLIVAKLDRLARNVHFISGLMESGVPFDCADRPGADPFRLHIESAIAEEEARKISKRTKEALAEAKAAGTKLGAANPACRNLDDRARRKGAKATRTKAAAYYADVLPIITERRADGASLQTVADELNAAGHVTQRGLPYTATAVYRIESRG